MACICIKKCCFKWISIDSFSLLDVYQLSWEHLSKHIVNGKSNHPWLKNIGDGWIILV
jgi:hypothetical protein